MAKILSCFRFSRPFRDDTRADGVGLGEALFSFFAACPVESSESGGRREFKRELRSSPQVALQVNFGPMGFDDLSCCG